MRNLVWQAPSATHANDLYLHFVCLWLFRSRMLCRTSSWSYNLVSHSPSPPLANAPSTSVWPWIYPQTIPYCRPSTDKPSSTHRQDIRRFRVVQGPDKPTRACPHPRASGSAQPSPVPGSGARPQVRYLNPLSSQGLRSQVPSLSRAPQCGSFAGIVTRPPLHRKPSSEPLAPALC